MSKVTDIWFKTDLELEELARRLGLTDAEFDCENVWEWITGKFEGKKLNISRTHLKPPQMVETHISLGRDQGPKIEFSESAWKAVAASVRQSGVSVVFIGESTLDKSDQFVILNVVQEVR